MPTINYWMRLPVPVFLVWTDINEERAFFAPVQAQVRKQYDKYQKQQSLSFEFLPDVELGTKTGLKAFLEFYLREALKFAALSSNEFVGFSMLVLTADGDAELYITVAPDRIDKTKGLGYAITLQTMYEGFVSHNLQRIHLKVRTWNTRAKNIYTNFGFIPVAEKSRGNEKINGEIVPMDYMQISRQEYDGENGRARMDPMVARFASLDAERT